MTPSPREISVIVPAGGVDEALGVCLAALAAQDPPPGEVLVVGDGPPAGIRPVAGRHGFRVLELPVRRGPAAARNAGAAAAEGTILLFLDADVAAPPDMAARVAARFAERPGLAALFGSYDDRPAAPGLVSQFRNLLHHWVHQRGRREATTFWAGCGAIRREIFEACGGFDEGFTAPSVEDIELGHELAAAGASIGLDPDLQVTHLKRWTLRSMVWTDVVHRAAPWTRLMLRRRRLDRDLNLRLSQRAAAGLAVLLPAAVGGAAAEPALWPGAAAGLAALLALNWPFYRFLLRRRGLPFAAAAFPLHWLHLVCCVAGLGLGVAQHLAGVPAGRRIAPAAPEEAGRP